MKKKSAGKLHVFVCYIQETVSTLVNMFQRITDENEKSGHLSHTVSLLRNKHVINLMSVFDAEGKNIHCNSGKSLLLML